MPMTQPQRPLREHRGRLVPAWSICCTVLLCGASEGARASCAEDLTRIQLALPKAPPDVQSRLSALVIEAAAEAKARDDSGCEGLTSQALQDLQLPVLPPLKLSTPIAGAEEP